MNENSNKSIRLNIEELKTNFSKLSNHQINHVRKILPFIGTSGNPPIKEHFDNVFGDFVRNLHGIALSKKDKELLHIDHIREYVEEKVNFTNEEDKHKFFYFLKRFIFDGDKIKPVYPNLYIYLVPDKYERDMSKYGKFLCDILINDPQSLVEVFSKKDESDVLLDLLLSSLENIQLSKSNKNRTYRALLPILSNQYVEDLMYLSKHQNYFMRSFPLITRYYLFMYTCQLIFKFEQFIYADFNTINTFYFALEWESVSKRRDAAEGFFSFKWIKEHAEHLFPHVHTMGHLSTNSFNKKVNDSYEFLTYNEIFHHVSRGTESEKKQFIEDVNEWIKFYPQLKMTQNYVEVKGENDTLESAFKELHDALKRGMSEQTRKRYGQHVEHLGHNYFIKHRGRLGYVFNITHDILLLLTALSVKDKRIPVSELFDEFEKRGVALDERSKEEVIKYLDCLNYIDKKSDSGDARYVKPIL